MAEKHFEEKLKEGLPDRQRPTQEQMRKAFDAEEGLIRKHGEWISLVLDLAHKGELPPSGPVEIPIDPETTLEAELKDGKINKLAIYLTGKQVFYEDFERLRKWLLKKEQ